MPGSLPTDALGELVEATAEDADAPVASAEPGESSESGERELELAYSADATPISEALLEEPETAHAPHTHSDDPSGAGVTLDASKFGLSTGHEHPRQASEHRSVAADRDGRRFPAGEAPPRASAEADDGGACADPTLLLRLFGTLRLEWADGTEIPQPKGGGKAYGIMAGREVLSYLALHRGWVDSEALRRKILGPQEVRSPEQQQASINNGISHVRAWVQGGLPAELRASLSVAELRDYAIERDPTRGYRLNTRHVWVDVRAFEDAIAEARGAEYREAALRRALELYTGDLLTNYGRSGNSQREPFIFRDAISVYLRGEACVAADRLASILQDTGRPEEALRVVAPMLDGALCELLERRAMAIEGEATPRGLGDRTRVHRRWQLLRDRLVSEFGAGTEPEPTTLAVYGQIMRSSAA